MKSILILFLYLFVCFASAENYAIVNGTIHTLSAKGVLDKGTVLIKDGKVENVLAGDQVPAGYTRIDASNKIVTPGLFAAFTALGLEEVSLSAGTVDKSVKTTPVSNTGAALQVHYAVNPDSSLFDITRIEGVTSVASSMTRSEQMFSGQGALVTLGSKSDPVIKANAFMLIDVSNDGADKTGGSRAALWSSLEQAFDEARLAAKKSFSPLSGPSSWHGMSTQADAKALNKVINGEIPLVFKALRASDIRNVIGFSAANPKIKPIILIGTEAWRVADELAAANIPVIVDPEVNLPYEFDQLGATMANAARLHKADVTIAFAGGLASETHNVRLIAQHAGNAVANGLPYSAAIQALTLNPAKIFAVAEELGSIEAGKQADIVVWSGDPLEVTEYAEMVFIKGQLMPRESRQTKLRDRYLNIQKTKNMPYVRP